MKSFLRPIKLSLATIAVCTLCAFQAMGQGMPRIEARFANPVYSAASGSYTLDVELLSTDQQEALFGMNMRFFFDAALLQFKGIQGIQNGYNILGDAPKAYIGNSSSGIEILNLNQSAGYINTAIQVMDDRQPLDLHTSKWTRLCQVLFTVPDHVEATEYFCPSVIWDQKNYGERGSFLPGSDGLVITVIQSDRSRREDSAPSAAAGLPFNWQYTSAEAGKPTGRSASFECISLSGTVSTENPDKVDADGYALFQNQPNPFEVFTNIEFILPVAEEASIRIFDANGTVLEEIKGFYEKGSNQILLKQKPWMIQTKALFYRLETKNYTSDAKTMTVVRV